MKPDEERPNSPDESAQAPDPNGPPQPIRGSVIVRSPSSGLGWATPLAMIAAAGVLFGLMTPTVGSTRSTRLRVGKRQRDIDKAIAAQTVSGANNNSIGEDDMRPPRELSSPRTPAP